MPLSSCRHRLGAHLGQGERLAGGGDDADPPAIRPDRAVELRDGGRDDKTALPHGSRRFGIADGDAPGKEAFSFPGKDGRIDQPLPEGQDDQRGDGSAVLRPAPDSLIRRPGDEKSPRRPQFRGHLRYRRRACVAGLPDPPASAGRSHNSVPGKDRRNAG